MLHTLALLSSFKLQVIVCRVINVKFPGDANSDRKLLGAIIVVVIGLGLDAIVRGGGKPGQGRGLLVVLLLLHTDPRNTPGHLTVVSAPPLLLLSPFFTLLSPSSQIKQLDGCQLARRQHPPEAD